MYWKNEDPFDLQESLNEARSLYAEATARAEDEEVLMNMRDEIDELERRLNTAWEQYKFDKE